MIGRESEVPPGEDLRHRELLVCHPRTTPMLILARSREHPFYFAIWQIWGSMVAGSYGAILNHFLIWGDAPPFFSPHLSHHILFNYVVNLIL